MKYTIIKIGVAFGISILLLGQLFAQGIRKEHLEMTNAERNALIEAYWAVADDVNMDGPILGAFGEMGTFHGNNYTNIHFSNTADTDVFLAWHRLASVELQRTMKDTMNNEWITIPYWDWTISNLKSDPLWGADWIGPFDNQWGLLREATSSLIFPVQADIDNAKTETNFYQFSRYLVEGADIHSVGHNWTGGIMSSHYSPLDPVFFFHHNMIDKIWAEWHKTHHTPGNDYYIKTDMPRYDGTFVNGMGDLLPSVDPDAIVDPRSLGIFYAENGLAVLDKYTVSNTATTDEKFGYQYTIEAKEDFIIPAGKSATMKSCNEVIMRPGFLAANGSTFLAAVDQDCDFSTSARVSQPQFVGTSKSSFVLDKTLATAYQDKSDVRISEGVLLAAPNPFHRSSVIEFVLPADSKTTLSIHDLSGRQIALLMDGQLAEGYHQVTFTPKGLSPGVYLAKLKTENGVETLKLILTE